MARLDEQELIEISVKAGFKQGFKAGYTTGYEKGKSSQKSVLDKIRAEILEEKECAYADFERYKVEYLGQEWEDAYDSLPQDDFRYGMERCIAILDKYKNESEGKG